MWFWLVLSGFIAGGFTYSFIILHFGISGVLKIDRKSSEKDIYRFELNDLDKLDKAKRVILKVDRNADLSQN